MRRRARLRNCVRARAVHRARMSRSSSARSTLACAEPPDPPSLLRGRSTRLLDEFYRACKDRLKRFSDEYFQRVDRAAARQHDLERSPRVSAKVDNLLSKILVIPEFLRPDECETLVRDFDTRTDHQDLRIGQDLLSPLQIAFGFSDFDNPGKLLARVQQDQIAAIVMLKYMGTAAMGMLSAVSSLRDIDEVHGSRAVDALGAAARDPKFFVDL